MQSTESTSKCHKRSAQAGSRSVHRMEHGPAAPLAAAGSDRINPATFYVRQTRARCLACIKCTRQHMLHTRGDKDRAGPTHTPPHPQQRPGVARTGWSTGASSSASRRQPGSSAPARASRAGSRQPAPASSPTAASGRPRTAVHGAAADCRPAASSLPAGSGCPDEAGLGAGAVAGSAEHAGRQALKPTGSGPLREPCTHPQRTKLGSHTARLEAYLGYYALS